MWAQMQKEALEKRRNEFWAREKALAKQRKELEQRRKTWATSFDGRLCKMHLQAVFDSAAQRGSEYAFIHTRDIPKSCDSFPRIVPPTAACKSRIEPDGTGIVQVPWAQCSRTEDAMILYTLLHPSVFPKHHKNNAENCHVYWKKPSKAL